jgi:hypothetical protein
MERSMTLNSKLLSNAPPLLLQQRNARPRELWGDFLRLSLSHRRKNKVFGHFPPIQAKQIHALVPGELKYMMAARNVAGLNILIESY